MIRLLVKLAIAAFIANAAWRAGAAAATHYQFRDSVRQAALTRGQSDEQLQQRILELAGDYDIALAADAFTVRRDDRHVYVQGAYEKKVLLVPGFEYPWRFTWDVDAYVIEPPRMP
jgi:hypothetical protein